jgi:hypothetical protein
MRRGSLEVWNRGGCCRRRNKEKREKMYVCLMDQVYRKYSLVGRATRSIARGLDVIDSLGIEFKLASVRLEK